jgi:hypothetical protein
MSSTTSASPTTNASPTTSASPIGPDLRDFEEALASLYSRGVSSFHVMFL